MKAMSRLPFFAVLIVLLSCQDAADDAGITIFPQNYDFSVDQQGWQHGFAEYPASPKDSASYELRYAYTPEPAGSKTVMLSGHNRNNQLFMYLKRKLDGLAPNTTYTLTFNVSLFSNATEVNTGAVASGENVLLKAGASPVEPKSVIDKDKDRYIMNIDKGDQGESGDNMTIIGNILSPSTTTQITRTNSTYVDSPFRVKSNSKGEIWLIVGTDSGATGISTLYYSKINVTLSNAN
jgi:hypothetical protein